MELNDYLLAKNASYNIIPIASIITTNTGNTSRKPIIGDLVNVVAKPTKNIIAREHPIIFEILLFIFTIIL